MVYKIICPQKIRERSLEKKEVCITARYIGGVCQNPGSQWVFLFFLFCNEGNPNRPLRGLGRAQKIYVPWSKVAKIGDGRPPTFNDGILKMGPYKPLRTWVDEFIHYYMEIMGVERPWHIFFSMSFLFGQDLVSKKRENRREESVTAWFREDR